MSDAKSQAYPMKCVQTFGKRKSSTAVATVTKGPQCDIRVNGIPISLIQPVALRTKVLEPLYVVGTDKFSRMKIKITVRGGGPVSQAYAVRQAIAKGLVAFHQKYKNEASKAGIKEAYMFYDKHLLIADPRRPEPKKWGRHSARSRFTKSYR